MADKGKRMIFEDEYQYLKDVKANYPDPSDIGGGEVIDVSEYYYTVLPDDIYNKIITDKPNLKIYDKIYYPTQWNDFSVEYNNTNQINSIKLNGPSLDDDYSFFEHIESYVILTNGEDKGIHLISDGYGKNIFVNVTPSQDDIIVPLKNIKIPNEDPTAEPIVLTASTEYTEGYGIDITGSTVSIDTSVVPTISGNNSYTGTNSFKTLQVLTNKANFSLVSNQNSTADDYRRGLITFQDYDTNQAQLKLSTKSTQATQLNSWNAPVEVNTGSGMDISFKRTNGDSYKLPSKTAATYTIATTDDIPTISGTNDGTNWTSLTIGSDTYNVPSGGSSSQTYTHVIEVKTYASNGARYHWFTINIINSSSTAMTWADLYDYIMSLSNKHIINGIYHNNAVSTSDDFMMWAIYKSSGYLSFNINGTSDSDMALNRTFTPNKFSDTVIAN